MSGYRLVTAALILLLALSTVLVFFPQRSEAGDGGCGCLNTVYVNGAAGNDSYDGSSPVFVSGSVGPKQTIQAGIDAVCPGGTVDVAAGTYSPTSFIDVNKSVTLAGAGASATILNGSALSSSEVVDIEPSSGGTVVISGLTVQNGSDSGIHIPGGSPASNVSINNCAVINNFSPDVGGGIAADNTTLNMAGCTISGNAACAWGGGLFYYTNTFDQTVVPTISSCTFSNNLAGRSGGAAFFVVPASVFSGTFTGSPLEAAIKSFENNGSFTSDLTGNKSVSSYFPHSLKPGNTVKSGSVFPDFPVPSLINCNIVNNQAGNWGGGVTEAYAAVFYNGCTISGNSAEFVGGGVGGLFAAGLFFNCTISGNSLTYPNLPFALSAAISAGKFTGSTPITIQSSGLPPVSNAGGGIGLIIGVLYFDCDTIANNSAGLSDNESYGGGIFDSQGTYLEFVNTIVANNRAFQTSNNNCLNRGEIFTDGHNIDSQNSCGFTDPTDQINTNPLLGPLQNNGGPTQTCAITDSSPAFDRGTNDPDFMPPTDQRGITRPQGAYCDIGAYELVLTKSQTTNTVVGAGGLVTYTTSTGGMTGLTALPIDACGALSVPVNFPYGIFSFNIVGIVPGSTAQVTVNLPSPIAGNLEYWKCSGAAGWTNVTSLITYTPGSTTLTLNLTDGGLGDADGVANGRIVDPGGPAFLSNEKPQSSSAYIAPPQQPMAVPSLAVQSASLSAAKVDSGMPVTVTALVANRGSANGNMRLTLYVNSREEASQVVSVPKGSSVPVKFTVIKDEPGTYTVYVGGITAGSFTVNDWVNPDKIFFISSGLLFCALVIGIYMLWRRRRYS